MEEENSTAQTQSVPKSSSKNWAAVGILALVLVGGGYFSLAKLHLEPTATGDITANISKAVIVNITSAGFNPNTITIPAGTTVTFVNKDGSPHWPASDPHPIHTDLKGFDSRRGLKYGEHYSYTFTKVGTIGCHDHINAALTCKIIVQ